jgi:hypothetical protein
MTIKFSPLQALISLLALGLIIGLVVGIYLGKTSERQMWQVEIGLAIEAGEATQLKHGGLIIVPDRQWTAEAPVNYIYDSKKRWEK